MYVLSAGSGNRELSVALLNVCYGLFKKAVVVVLLLFGVYHYSYHISVTTQQMATAIQTSSIPEPALLHHTT